MQNDRFATALILTLKQRPNLLSKQKFIIQEYKKPSKRMDKWNIHLKYYYKKKQKLV